MRILYSNADIVTPDKTIKSGYLVTDGEYIESVSDVRPDGRFDLEKDLSNHIIIPGLVNAHTHAPMTLLRGLGNDLPLKEWLFDTVMPVEDHLVDDDIRVGTELAMLEMIACGTTSFTDMYFSPYVTAEVVEKCGIKANLCVPVQSFIPGETFAQNERSRKMEAFYKEWGNRANGRIKLDACVHAEYTCNEDVSAGVADFAKANGMCMHIHMSETENEHNECIRKYGETPAQWMNRLGVFDVPCAAAHCVWVTEDDMRIMKEKGVSAVHNPSSNMKLASGFAPIPRMLELGINVGLGTDGTASNNNLNMFEEMHLAALIHNGVTRDATVVPSKEILRIATENGYKLQGRKNTGKLEKGMKADFAVIDTDRPHLIPNLDSLGLVVYSAQGSDVTMTVVDGKILYENGEFLTLDKEKILTEAKQVSIDLLNR